MQRNQCDHNNYTVSFQFLCELPIQTCSICLKIANFRQNTMLHKWPSNVINYKKWPSNVSNYKQWQLQQITSSDLQTINNYVKWPSNHNKLQTLTFTKRHMAFFDLDKAFLAWIVNSALGRGPLVSVWNKSSKILRKRKKNIQKLNDSIG